MEIAPTRDKLRIGMQIPLTEITVTEAVAVGSAIIGVITAFASFMEWYGGGNRYLWLLGALLFNILAVVLWSALPELRYADRSYQTIAIAGICSMVIAGLWIWTCPRLLDRLQESGLAILARVTGYWRKLPIFLAIVPIAAFVVAVVLPIDDRPIIVVAITFKGDGLEKTFIDE